LTALLEKIKNTSRIDYINYLILIYAFTLSFPSEIKRVVAISMIILWLTDRTKYNFKLPKTNLFLFFWIFIGYSLLSYFWSEVTFYEALKYIRRYWYYLPIFIIFKYLKKEYFEYTISYFLLGMFISEILSYGNFFSFWTIGLGETNNPTVFIHHTTNSIFLAIVSIFLLSRIFTEESKTKKIIYLVFFITVTINLLVNSGRTGYFSFFITIIISIIFIYKLKIQYIITSLFSLLLLFLLAYNFSTNFNSRLHLMKDDINQIILNENYNTSIGARIGFWIIAKNILEKDPLLGTGIANQINIKNRIIDTNKTSDFEYVRKLEHFHNNYLEILTQYGLVGFTLFLLIIIEIFKIKVKSFSINLLKISAVTIYLLGCFTDMLFYLKDSMIFFSFIIGIVLAQYKIEYQDTIKI
jgi:O-antigen ligase